MKLLPEFNGFDFFFFFLGRGGVSRFGIFKYLASLDLLNTGKDRRFMKLCKQIIEIVQTLKLIAFKMYSEERKEERD